MISIVIPTHNEATIIRENLERVLAFLRRTLQEPWELVVADNGSSDATRAIVRDIATRESRITLLEIPKPGKGGAVIAAWREAVDSQQSTVVRPHPPSPPLPEGGGEIKKNSFSPSQQRGSERGYACKRVGEVEGVGESHDSRRTTQCFVFMDADLATDLSALLALIAAIRNGADIAIGSRYMPGAQVERSWSRQVISWCYRLLLRSLFNLRASDPPCGFKAVSARVVRDIVPLVRDRHWFFDTELLIRAQRAGMRIIEIPVAWREHRRGASLRKVLRIITSDLRAMWRLHRELRKT